MNTLTESELTEISASGDGRPVASWPGAGLFSANTNLSWLSLLLASNNVSAPLMAD